MLLKDKVAVISGAAGVRGIGYATAKLFASQGAKVVILDLDASASTKAAESLGGEHLGLACDVADRSACERAVGQVMAKFGRLDVLINNAGITQPVKFLEIEPNSRTEERRVGKESVRTC